MSPVGRHRVIRFATTAVLLVGASFGLAGHEVLGQPAPTHAAAAAPQVLGRVWERAEPPATTAPATPEAAPIADGAPAAETVIKEPTDLPVAYATPSAPPPTRRPAIGSGTWAVVIGINDYPGDTHDLEAGVADADQMAELLDRVGSPSSQRRVLRNGEATSQAILGALDWLVANAGPDATAVVFYAGHARSTDGRESIVSVDGTLIRDTVLAERLVPLAARRAWIVMSACFGGGFTELLAPGRVLTAAAPAGERAYETTQYRASYLVEFMVRRALVNREAAASLQDAFGWARRQLEREHPGRVPVQFERDAASFAVYPTTTPARSEPPTSQPPPAQGEPSPPPPPQNQPPEPIGEDPDSCTTLTLGTVTCGS